MLKVLIPDTTYLEQYRDASEMQGFLCSRLTQARCQVLTKPFYYFPFSAGHSGGENKMEKLHGLG